MSRETDLQEALDAYKASELQVQTLENCVKRLRECADKFDETLLAARKQSAEALAKVREVERTRDDENDLLGAIANVPPSAWEPESVK